MPRDPEQLAHPCIWYLGDRLVWAAEPVELGPAPASLAMVGVQAWRVLTWADTHGQEGNCRSLAYCKGDSSRPVKQ